MTLLLGTIKATTQPMTNPLLKDIHSTEGPELLAFIGKHANAPSDWEYGLALMYVREEDDDRVYADITKSWIAT